MAEALNAMQMAWLRAVERKTGKRINVESAEDVRVLARMYTQASPAETLAEDDQNG